MFCTQCGKKISDDARFCPHCGSPTGGAPAASDEPSGEALPASAESAGGNPQAGVAPTPDAPQASAATAPTISQASAEPSPDATTGDIGAQVAEARKSAKRKMPLFLLVVLVALGVATTAFAATMVWRYVIAPAIEARQEVVVEAVTEAPAESEPAATTEATTSEPATTEAATTTDNTAAQQAVFNDILSEYKSAQDSGWASTDSELLDLGMLVSLQSSEYYSQTYPVDNISYAYTDLGNDGTLDLVVSQDSEGHGSEAVYGIYLSNGSVASPISETGVSLSVKYISWGILSDGTIVMFGGHNDGAITHRTATRYSVENGETIELETYQVDGDRSTSETTYTYYHNDEAIPESEFAPKNGSWVYATLDWQPLANFSPVEP